MKVVIHITMSWWRLTCEACDTCYYVMVKVVKADMCEGCDTCYYVMAKADMKVDTCYYLDKG